MEKIIKKDLNNQMWKKKCIACNKRKKNVTVPGRYQEKIAWS